MIEYRNVYIDLIEIRKKSVHLFFVFCFLRNLGIEREGGDILLLCVLCFVFCFSKTSKIQSSPSNSRTEGTNRLIISVFFCFFSKILFCSFTSATICSISPLWSKEKSYLKIMNV